MQRKEKKEVKKKSFSKGISLIESLIALAVFVFVLLGLLSFYISGQRYFINQDARADTIENCRYPLALIAKEIKGAIQVVQGPIFVGEESYSTSENCLVLKIPSIDSDGLIIDIENDFDYIIYCRTSDYPNRLKRIIDGKDGVSSREDKTWILADDVNSFVLSFFDSEGSAVSDYSESVLIDISISSRKKGLGRYFQESTNTQVKLRNKS